MRWFSGVFAIVYLLPLGSSSAITPEQKEALAVIRETADDICYTVTQAGQANSARVLGEIQAKITGVASKVVDLGVSGSGEFDAREFTGVLQSDLAAALRDSAACRKGVFDKLEAKLLTTASPPPLPPQASTPTPETSDVLYETGINKSGFEDWVLTPDWKRLNGMLVNDGTGSRKRFDPAFASYRPESADYAIEAKIRVISDSDN